MQIYNFALKISNILIMSKNIRLKKGLNIRLSGESEQVYSNVKASNIYEIKPTDFQSLVPKLAV